MNPGVTLLLKDHVVCIIPYVDSVEIIVPFRCTSRSLKNINETCVYRVSSSGNDSLEQLDCLITCNIDLLVVNFFVLMQGQVVEV